MSGRPTFSRDRDRLQDQRTKKAPFSHFGGDAKGGDRRKGKRRDRKEGEVQVEIKSEQPRESVQLTGLSTIEHGFLERVKKDKGIILDRFKREETQAGFIYSLPRDDAKRLNNYQGHFRDQPFQFTIVTPGSAFTDAQKQHISNVLLSLYNPESKFLNLAGLIDNEHLKGSGVTPDLKRLIFSSFVWSKIKELMPQVETIDFSNNRLNSLGTFKNLPNLAPAVLNLSFEKNSLTKFEDLENLSKWKNLKELILKGNPIMDDHEKQLEEEVGKIFPGLSLLNGNKIRAFMVPTVDVESELPAVNPPFIDPRTQSVVKQLLDLYFNAFDNNRENIAAFYHDNATFSYYYESGLSKKGPKDRNLHKRTDIDQGVRLVSATKYNIAASIREFAATKHDPNVIVDAWEESDPVSCLLVFAHGHLLEGQGQEKREFDRTFVLKPSRDHSAAHERGLLFEIQADQLRIRRCDPERSIIAKLAQSIVPAPTPTLTSQQKELLQVVVNQTNLKPERAQQLLEVGKWTLDEALRIFSTTPIPADYFR